MGILSMPFEAPRPKKIRISEAAAAIGTTYKAIRHWLDRYRERGIEPKAEQTGGWMEFSLGDIAALAITKHLVDFGVPAYKAFEIAMTAVQARWPGLFDPEEPNWKFRDPNDNIFHLHVGHDHHGEWYSNASGYVKSGMQWADNPGVYRSEERRVGKECRCRRWRWQ